MRATYDSAMTRGVFPHEGGYTNEATDPGGPTNWGITIADARAYWKPSATATDVRVMPKVIAEDIYRKHYASPIRYDDLPAGVDYSVLDYAINSGVGRAGRVLRRLVNMSDNTSAVTDEVLDAVRKRDPTQLVNAINRERLAFLGTLKNWPTYANGWSRRVAEVRQLSLDFVKDRTTISAASNKPAQGKGQVPEAKGAKNVTIAIGGAGGVGFAAWAHKHPALAIFIGCLFAACVVAIISYLNHRRELRQHAATPGITPVPEAT